MNTRGKFLLVGAFVVVDAVLVVGALRNGQSDASADEAPSVSASATPATPGVTPTTSGPDSDQVAYQFKASEAVALSSDNDGTVVYGTRGRCGGAQADLMVSTNAGADFAIKKTGLTTTLAVKADRSSITVVGTGSGCSVRQVVSTDGGSTWAPSESITLWHPSPKDDSTVVTPGRSLKPAKGCVVTSVSQVTDVSGRVSCADGTIVGSGNDGKSWVRLGRLDNVRVSAFLTPSAGVALARYNGCGANEFSTTDGGVTWTPGGCIGGDPAQAIAATSNGLTAVVAGTVYASADEGATWTQP